MKSREELLQILQVMGQPKKHGLTQNGVEQALINFCVGCPDPVQARWLIVECLEPMTDGELVDRALSMPLRSISDVPTSIVPADHPAREKQV